jgi:hypothetical protein
MRVVSLDQGSVTIEFWTEDLVQLARLIRAGADSFGMSGDAALEAMGEFASTAFSASALASEVHKSTTLAMSRAVRRDIRSILSKP